MWEKTQYAASIQWQERMTQFCSAKGCCLTLDIEVGGGDDCSPSIISHLSYTLVYSMVCQRQLFNPQHPTNTGTVIRNKELLDSYEAVHIPGLPASGL